MLRLLPVVALFGAFAPSAHPLLVTPGSPCASSCGNVNDATSPDDISCDQGSYASGNGHIFQTCVECELSSTFAQGGTSDVQSLLYNMRYAASYCVFGYPGNDEVWNSPCMTSKACGVFAEALRFRNLSSEIESYDYCAAWPTGDFEDLNGCKNCLRLSDEDYLANYIAVLQAGCEQQPVAGDRLALEGEVFSEDRVNGTNSVPEDAIDPAWFDQGPLSMGARVGIAAAGIVVILSIIGCFVVWRGKRKRRAFLRTLEQKHGNRGWPSPSNSNAEMFETTPGSANPLRGWDDSPMSSNADRTHPRYFSPYSSQFSSPVSASVATPMQWPAQAQGVPRVIGVALAGSDDHDEWQSPIGDDKGKTRGPDAYELHEVSSGGGENPIVNPQRHYEAPVLGHPGYGRTDDSLPRQYAVDNDNGRGGPMWR